MIRLKKIIHTIMFFNQKDINTFDVLTFIRVGMDKHKFIHIRRR